MLTWTPRPVPNRGWASSSPHYVPMRLRLTSTVVGLIVAHGVLIASGYAITTQTDLVAQAVTLVRDYPDVLMATAGLVG